MVVTGAPTILKPSTTRSATAVSAGFREGAAFWTHHRFGHSESDARRADGRGPPRSGN